MAFRSQPVLSKTPYWVYLLEKYSTGFGYFIHRPLLEFGKDKADFHVLYIDMERLVALYTLLILNKVFHKELFNLLRDMALHTLEVYVKTRFRRIRGQLAFPFYIATIEEMCEFSLPEDLRCKMSSHTKTKSPCCIFNASSIDRKLNYMFYKDGTKSKPYDGRLLKQFLKYQRGAFSELKDSKLLKSYMKARRNELKHLKRSTMIRHMTPWADKDAFT